MSPTGMVYKQVAEELGIIDTENTPNYMIVSLIVKGKTVVTFPLPLGSDSTEVSVRMGNIINQTGLVKRPVEIVMDEP